MIRLLRIAIARHQCVSRACGDDPPFTTTCAAVDARSARTAFSTRSHRSHCIRSNAGMAMTARVSLKSAVHADDHIAGGAMHRSHSLSSATINARTVDARIRSCAHCSSTLVNGRDLSFATFRCRDSPRCAARRGSSGKCERPRWCRSILDHTPHDLRASASARGQRSRGYGDASGGDANQTLADLEGDMFEDLVKSDFLTGVGSGVNGTPTFCTTGVRFEGNRTDADKFAAALEAAN